MCVIGLILPTNHPKYDLVLVSNRDEYLNRVCSKLIEDDDYLYPEDPVTRGSYMSICKKSKKVCLIQTIDDGIGSKSRGLFVLDCVKSGMDREYIKSLERDGTFRKLRGLTLVSLDFSENEPTASIISNRSKKVGLVDIKRDELVTIVGNHPFREEFHKSEVLKSKMGEVIRSKKFTTITSPSEMRDYVMEPFYDQSYNLLRFSTYTKFFRFFRRKCVPGPEYFRLALTIFTPIILLFTFYVLNFTFSFLHVLFSVLFSLLISFSIGLWVHMKHNMIFSMISLMGLLPESEAFGTITQCVILREKESKKLHLFFRDVSHGWYRNKTKSWFGRINEIKKIRWDHKTI